MKEMRKRRLEWGREAKTLFVLKGRVRKHNNWLEREWSLSTMRMVTRRPRAGSSEGLGMMSDDGRNAPKREGEVRETRTELRQALDRLRHVIKNWEILRI